MVDHNIASVLTDVALRQPERIAIIETKPRPRQWTFRQLDEHVNACCHGLAAAGVGKGDRVMLMVRPSFEFVALTFALFRIGAPVILIDPGMGYKNLLKCIESVQPKVFIGIPKAHVFKNIFPKVFGSIHTDICVGPSFGLFGPSLAKLLDFKAGAFINDPAGRDDLAAIIFTTGSTGPPKGVQYTHGVFHAQLALIRDYYQITPDDIDQPAFPLFALFSAAMGACAVIPVMNPAQPARLNPAKFVASILKYKVTYSFGSPAIWNVVSRYCLEKGITLPSVKKILMAGAPVSGELIHRMQKILPAASDIHTPYGATESLPVASMTGSEVVNSTWEMTRQGKGTCVGRPLPGVNLKIIQVVGGPVASWQEANELAAGEIGEIVVRGEVVTRKYDHNDKENQLAKIIDADGFWHRIGDVGYIDTLGRLWFCGRKAHRVITPKGIFYTIPCEALFNEHPLVFRSALVGVEIPTTKQIMPVLVVEPYERVKNEEQLFADLRKIAISNELTVEIEHFLINPAFPVDIRHNAKIFREKLASWATDMIPGD